ncbi:photoreceptor cilium actin regulator [Astyanax mexicanus]|uniref:photoreceptor cilium actin regulator n=1 Tax=Astyanax mexicanus TaxID=7994 RepID=UPI0020CABB26|nr:photoreceptor cilium actin regulator [Astyanax mexicanus]
MGCSPSKGQLFTGVSTHKALQENNGFVSDGTENQSKTETEIVSAGLTILEEENTLEPQCKRPSLSDVVCDTAAINREALDAEGTVDSQVGLLSEDNAEKKNEIKKKNKGAKRRKQKERMRKTVQIQSKVDFPEKMMIAHQAAYAFIDPNISKYESLLGILDQATKTQLSLQPLAALLAVHYEELNQALEEMAVEGEQMLEEHGNHMVWPAALREVRFNTTKLDAEMYSHKPPPYTMHQMLLLSTEKIKLVGDSVKGLGDAALEEAADYFASLSRMLGEKLVMKRAAEKRLKQVLDYVEAAALKKPGLEDSALHSEDSGIGADNECQNGSVRLCRHRESSGSGASTDLSSGCPENTLPSQPHLNGVNDGRNDDEDDEEDDDDDEEDSNEDEEEVKDEQERKTAARARKMSNCSQAGPRKHSDQTGLQNSMKWANQKNTKIRRSKTADNSSVKSQGNYRNFHLRGLRRAQSADCLYSKEDDNIVKGQEKRDNQKDKSTGNALNGGVVLDCLGRTRLRRHSSEGQNTARCYGLQYGSKGPFKATLQPNSPPAFAPAPPGRNAVKRLINTFSQGVQEQSNQKPLNGPMKVRGTKKGFLPMINNSKGGVSSNGNNNNNSYSADQRPDDVDVDSLPPPPPEVLMDNSFESNEGPCEDEESNGSLNQRCSTQRQRYGVSRLRASMQTVTVLPSRASVPRRAHSISPARPLRQDAVSGSRQGQDCHQESGVSAQKEEATSLYQQSRKIIHMRHSSHSPAKTGFIRSGSVGRQGSRDTGENDTLAPYPNSYAPTTPPVSRARLPPSCPSVCHRVPSPPVLPSATSSTPGTQIWTRRCSDEENVTSSFSFNDARSVFCQDTQSGSQSLTPSCRSTLPRPWGEPSRGRRQTTRPPQTYTKSSSPSPVRSTLSEQHQPLPIATQPHSQESERRDSASVLEVAQENPESCGVTDPLQDVTGAQEAEPREITDNQD